MGNIFDLVATLRLDKSGFDSGIGSAGDSMERLSAGVVAKGTLIAHAIEGIAQKSAQIIGGFITDSVQTTMGFERGMAQVGATLGKDMEQLESEVGSVDLAWGHFEGTLRDFAQEMGQHTKFTASEASAALNYMALAGYDAQQSMEMLPTVLNLAAAGNMDLAKASDMVTDAQRAFGLALEDGSPDMKRTSQLVDEMAKAASTGNTNVEQLGEAFLRIGGLAKELNGGMITLEDGTQVATDGFQDLSTAFVAMANSGIKGSEAGTHMRNMLLKLSNPTKDGTAALENMGIKIFDTEGKMRSLSEIFGDLNEQFKTMTQEEKIGVISDLFNTRDMASATALLSAVEQDWDRIGASILDAQGAAQKMADTQLNNLAGDITIFNSALEGTQIALGEKLTPSLRVFVQKGTEGIGALTNKIKDMDFTKLGEALEKLADSFFNALSKIDIETLLINVVNAVTGFVDFIANNLDNIINMVKTAIQFFVGLKIVTTISSIIGAIGNIIPVIGAVVGALSPVGAIIAGIIAALVALAPMFPEIAQAVGDFVGMVVQGLQEFFGAVVDAIGGAVKLIADSIPQILEIGKNIITGLWESIKNGIGALVEVMGNVAKAIIDGIVQLPSKILELGKNIITGLWEGIKSGFSAVVELIGGIVTAIVNGIAGLPQAVMTTGANLIGGFISGIRDGIGGLIDVVGNIVGAVVNGLAGLPGAVLDIGKNVIGGFVDGVGKFIDGAAKTVTGAFGGIVDGVANFLGIASPSKVFAQLGRYTAEGFGNGFDDQFSTVKGAIDKDFEALSDRDVDINGNLSYSAIKTAKADSTEELLNILISKIDTLSNQQIVLDTGVLVGQTVSKMDSALGNLANKNARRVYA